MAFKINHIRAAIVSITITLSIGFPFFSSLFDTNDGFETVEDKSRFREQWHNTLRWSSCPINANCSDASFSSKDIKKRVESEFRIKINTFKEIKINQTIPIIVEVMQYVSAKSLRENYKELIDEDPGEFYIQRRLIKKAEKGDMEWVGLDRPEHDLKLALRSAGIDIEPRDQVSISQRKKLPQNVIWTISPKKTGVHTLILDIDKDLTTEQSAVLDATSKIISDYEADRTFYNNSNSLVIDIEVLTKWGVSQLTEDITRGILALIGIIIAFPLFSDWVRCSLENRKSTNK